VRSVLVARPSLIGLDQLEPVPLPVESTWDSPAPAISGSVTVVCSVGVDLDVVPTAADCRLLHGGEELWIVVPEGDDLPVTRALAGWLSPPAVVKTVPRDWAAFGP
jgi:hypothetical protein